MSSFTYYKKTINDSAESYEQVVFPFGNSNTVLTEGGFVSSSQFKAYTSISWKSNSLMMPMVAGEWRPILTNVTPTKGVDSGHCIIDDLGGGDYQYRYVDPNGLSRIFLCNINFGIDMRNQTTTKTIDFRLIYNGVPLDPFLQLVSNQQESASSSVLLPLNSGDIIDCEIRNVSDSNAILVRYFSIVVTEI